MCILLIRSGPRLLPGTEGLAQVSCRKEHEPAPYQIEKIQTVKKRTKALPRFDVLHSHIAYFRPPLAMLPRLHHGTAIDTSRLLVGWTVLGWAISIVWALTAVRRRQPY